MAKATWTYELPPIGSGSRALEDYEVLSASGERVGTVAVLLDKGGDRLLVVERGNPPLQNERRVVPWADVAGVDHDRLAVRLALEAADLDQVLELDPGLGEEGREDADARRVVDLPAGLIPAPARVGGGPRDTPKIGFAIGLHIVSAFALLAVVLLATREGASRGILWLLAVPALISAAAFLASYRAARRPYESAPHTGEDVPG